MKERLKKLYRKYREFIVYVIVGCCTTLLNFGLTYLCFRWIGDDGFNIVISNTIAWVISTTFGFFMYKLVVFRSKSMAPKTLLIEGSEFYGARLFSWGMESAGLYLLGTTLGFTDMVFAMVVENSAGTAFRLAVPGSMVAKLIMTVFVTISNYIFSKFVIFRKKETPESEEKQ